MVCNQIIVLIHNLIITTLGVSLSWFGYIPVELPFSPSSATYSIDGETPINFLLRGLPVNSTTTVYNQKFFETAQLSPTSHTLKVVYEGNDSTPLTLDYLIIQNGTSSSVSTSTTSSISSIPTSTGNAASATSTPRGIPVGSIAGGVIGGLALAVFAILGFLFLRRRQKLDAQKKALTSAPRPFAYSPLHVSSTTPNPSSGGFSYSPVPQTAQLGDRVTFGVKGRQVHHGSMPSVTNTGSIEPPSTYPTDLRTAVPLQQSGMNIANPSSSSSSSPPASASSSSAQRVLLPSKVEREVEALATLGPQRRNPSVPASVHSNDTWMSNANVVLHADSGIRMPSNTTSTGVVDVPPLYTPD